MTHWTVFWCQLLVPVSGASNQHQASGTRTYGALFSILIACIQV